MRVLVAPLDAVLKNIDWSVVEKRYRDASEGRITARFG